MVKRLIWKVVGGLDKRFELICSDIDLQMRIQEYGHFLFQPFIIFECIVAERIHDYQRLINKPCFDRAMLEYLWKGSDHIISNNTISCSLKASILQ